MFQGSHPYRTDDKGRIKLPAEYVEALGASFTLTRGQGGCLWLMPAPEWQTLVARLEGASIADQRNLALQRYYIGSAVTLSLDSQGRLSLPPGLRQVAGIQTDVMLVGIGPRAEVWARARWDAYQAQLTDAMIEELARSAGL